MATRNMNPMSPSRDIILGDLPGMDSPMTALYSPSPHKSGSGDRHGHVDANLLTPVPRGMERRFYDQDFGASSPAALVTELETRQAGDPHGTASAYRHLVKVLVKRLSAEPDTLSTQAAEKRQVERALDQARLELDSQRNALSALQSEVEERKEHGRLNQHSIALLDAKLGEKVRECLYLSNECDGLRRHVQCLVDTKAHLESQLETNTARLQERSSYIVELEARAEDAHSKLIEERQSRHEEAAHAAREHLRDQQQVGELTAMVDSMRRSLSATQAQLDEWSAQGEGDGGPAGSAQLEALVQAAQEEAAAAAAAAAAAEARAAGVVVPVAAVPMHSVLLLSLCAWPVLVALLLVLASWAYGNAHPGTAHIHDTAAAHAAAEAAASQATAALAAAKAMAAEQAAAFESTMGGSEF